MSRRGFVLLTTLGALLLLGAVTAAGFFTALQEWRIALNAEASLLAREAALSGIAAALAAGGGPLADLPDGASSGSVAGALPGARYDVTATRLRGDLMLLEAAGRDALLGIERVTVLPVRLQPLVPRARAAALLRQLPPAPLAARVSAGDTAPAGWRCGASLTAPAPIVIDSASPDSAFFALGPLGLAELAAWAARGAAVDSPMVIAAGDTALDGARAAGILVANGDVVLRGGARFVGTVVATGSVVFGPGGGTLTGAVVAGSIALGAGVPPSQVEVRYSSCATGVAGRFRAPLGALPGVRPGHVR